MFAAGSWLAVRPAARYLHHRRQSVDVTD